MITSRDVAQLAGVSVATVSRTFYNASLVSESTRNRVLQAAKELNYSPNLLASSLKSNKSRTIGLIVSDIKNPFYMYIAELLAHKLKHKKYKLLLAFCDEDRKLEKEAIQMLLSNRVEGIVFTPTCHSGTIERTLHSNKIFTLQLYRDAYADLSALIIDDSYGTFLATKHLMAHNHTRILLLDVAVEIPTQRESGYRRAFHENQQQVDERFFVRLPLLKNNQKKIKELIETLQPTAIIPVSSDTALQTIQVAKRLKMPIPEKLSMVMYDDQPWAEVMDITCISHPVEKIGNQVTDIILAYVANFEDAKVTKSLIAPKLVIRDSVRII